jgi:hypothetical protein
MGSCEQCQSSRVIRLRRALVLFGELPLTPACTPPWPWLDWAKAAELAKAANAPTNRSFLMVFSMFMRENNSAPLLTSQESYANHVARSLCRQVRFRQGHVDLSWPGRAVARKAPPPIIHGGDVQHSEV